MVAHVSYFISMQINRLKYCTRNLSKHMQHEEIDTLIGYHVSKLINGAGNSRRFINVSHISEILQEIHLDLTDSLLGFHAITGCDYVSCLFRKGKTAPWKRLIDSHKHIEAIRTLTTNEVDVCGVTSFICSLYGHRSSDINDARYKVFVRLTGGGCKADTKNIKKINCASLPPCQKTVEKHIQRAHYVSKIWEEV